MNSHHGHGHVAALRLPESLLIIGVLYMSEQNDWYDLLPNQLLSRVPAYRDSSDKLAMTKFKQRNSKLMQESAGPAQIETLKPYLIVRSPSYLATSAQPQPHWWVAAPASETISRRRLIMLHSSVSDSSLVQRAAENLYCIMTQEIVKERLLNTAAADDTPDVLPVCNFRLDKMWCCMVQMRESAWCISCEESHWIVSCYTSVHVKFEISFNISLLLCCG